MIEVNELLKIDVSLDRDLFWFSYRLLLSEEPNNSINDLNNDIEEIILHL